MSDLHWMIPFYRNYETRGHVNGAVEWRKEKQSQSRVQPPQGPPHR